MAATQEAIVKDPNYVVRVAKSSSMQETLEIEATPGVTGSSFQFTCPGEAESESATENKRQSPVLGGGSARTRQGSRASAGGQAQVGTGMLGKRSQADSLL